MKRLIHIVSLASLLALVADADAAAGPYDGDWNGSAVSDVRRCSPAVVILKVHGKDVTGQAKFEQNAPNLSDTSTINGTVLEDGHFGGTIGFNRVSGTFTASGFEGGFRSSDCAWTMDLRRTNK